MSKTIITSVSNPVNDIRTEEEFKNYFLKVKNLSESDLFIEFNNVLAAKHNILSIPSPLHEALEKQQIISVLNDKTYLICVLFFGQERIAKYDNENDLRSFHGLVQRIDNEVAVMNLDSENHGRTVISIIKKNII